MNSDDDAGGKFLGRVMGGIGLIAAYLILRGDQHAAPPRIRPPGLPNLGNTCYMNAVLQALGSLESFRACLDRVPPLPPHLSASAAAADAKGSRENQHSETSSASDKDDNINNSLCSHLCDDKEKRKKKKKTRFFAQSTLTPLRECIHHLSTHAADSANAVGKTLNDLIDILRTRIPGFLLQDQQDSLEFLILLIDVIEQDLAARNYGEGERQRASSDALAYSSSDVNSASVPMDAFAHVMQSITDKEGSHLDDGVPALQLQLHLQKDPLAKIKKPACTPLSGVLASILQCQVCGQQRAIAEASVCISATLRTARNQRRHHEETVEECLDSFFHKESVDNVECIGVGCRLVERLRQQVARGVLDEVLENTLVQIKAAMIPGFEEKLSRSVEEILSARRPSNHQRLRGGSPGAARACGHVAGAAALSAAFASDDDHGTSVKRGKPAATSRARVHYDVDAQEIGHTHQHFLTPRREHSKWYEMTRTPQVLCVQLQRRHFNLKTGRERKLMDRVRFEERLCMKHFTANNSDELAPVVWRLNSVVVHYGLFGEGGHYALYRRNVKMPDEEKDDEVDEEEVEEDGEAEAVEPGDGAQVKKKLVKGDNSKDGTADGTAGANPSALRSEWIFASDGDVRDADWEEVRKAEAYLLFYEKVEGGESLWSSATKYSAATELQGELFEQFSLRELYSNEMAGEVVNNFTV